MVVMLGAGRWVGGRVMARSGPVSVVLVADGGHGRRERS